MASRRGGRVAKTDVGSRIRGMGCHEGYQTAMHTLDQYRGTTVACRYCPPSTLTRPEALATLKTTFYEAVSRVVLGQPHLQLGITGENSKDPGFVRLEHIDLRNHVTWASVDDESRLKQLFEETMQTQLDSRYKNLATVPGWRVVILHNVGAHFIEVFYVWNHPHHDGMSGKIFHEDLLQNLNSIPTQNFESVLKAGETPESRILQLPDPTEALPPNPEMLSSWPMTPKFLVTALWKELKPTWLFPPDCTHATWAPVKTSPFKTQFRSFTINNSTVQRLIVACRKHQTTITGLFQALVLVSLTNSIPTMKGFASRTPYDLRHILPSRPPQYPFLEPKRSMCNYVSVIDHEFDAELVSSVRSKMTKSQPADAGLSPGILDIVWTVSARVRREIQARLDSGLWNDMIGIMKFVSDWLVQQKGEENRVRYLSWLVTNIGVLDGGINESEQNDRERWSVRRAELVLSNETPSAALSVAVMTVKNGDMRVTGSWQDCAVDVEIGDSLMRDLERWLMEVGRGDGPS
ncbi:hypothetical protein DM02DRAFT_563595 [Periconia macrospinosa]|uniref:Alcohol acetyltransferase n=1 Tax=Periconia macrospinosa TaxID=97972 RepID=A0A2V1DPX1_9PLEO|nr:hypothetical protein DM02DRAFT_563595 [Periconia macrospinosa]